MEELLWLQEYMVRANSAAARCCAVIYHEPSREQNRRVRAAAAEGVTIINVRQLEHVQKLLKECWRWYCIW